MARLPSGRSHLRTRLPKNHRMQALDFAKHLSAMSAKQCQIWTRIVLKAEFQQLMRYLESGTNHISPLVSFFYRNKRHQIGHWYHSPIICIQLTFRGLFTLKS